MLVELVAHVMTFHDGESNTSPEVVRQRNPALQAVPSRHVLRARAAP